MNVPREDVLDYLDWVQANWPRLQTGCRLAGFLDSFLKLSSTPLNDLFMFCHES